MESSQNSQNGCADSPSQQKAGQGHVTASDNCGQQQFQRAIGKAPAFNFPSVAQSTADRVVAEVSFLASMSDSQGAIIRKAMQREEELRRERDSLQRMNNRQADTIARLQEPKPYANIHYDCWSRICAQLRQPGSNQSDPEWPVGCGAYDALRQVQELQRKAAAFDRMQSAAEDVFK